MNESWSSLIPYERPSERFERQQHYYVPLILLKLPILVLLTVSSKAGRGYSDAICCCHRLTTCGTLVIIFPYKHLTQNFITVKIQKNINLLLLVRIDKDLEGKNPLEK